MKAIIAIFLLSLNIFAAPVKPQELHWLGYKEGLAKAKETNKLIFVDLYANWCVPCRVMDKNVYSDPTIVSILNNRFIPVKLDVDSEVIIKCDDQIKTVKRCYFDGWNLQTLPAFVLIAPKGLSILTVSSSPTKDQMQMLLYQFLEKEKEWVNR